MKFIIGKKIDMTQVFAKDGTAVPVTRVKAGPCQVVQVRVLNKEKINLAQIGFLDDVEEKRLKNPQIGHLKGLSPVKILRDFRVEEKEQNLKRGMIINVETFAPGDKVEVSGQSKGKGFAGVVKRHHFRGGPASHGHKDNLRAPGSIGAGGVQRVFKGMRMAGRMGGAQITIKNLEIIQVMPEKNELYIKGAVPGGRNSILLIQGSGDLKVKIESEKVVVQTNEQQVNEQQATEQKVEQNPTI